MMEQTTSKVWLFLLKVYRAGTFAYYFVNNMEDIVGPAGQTYTGYPFTVSLPEDKEDRPPVIRLCIDNIDNTPGIGGHALLQSIREITEPFNVELSVVLSDTPTTLEIGPLTFTVRKIDYDAQTLTAWMTYEALFDEVFPCHMMSPHYFPGIYTRQLPPLGRAGARGGVKYIYARGPESKQ